MANSKQPLQVFAETVSPTGSISSKGILNQLGRPKLDTLSVLVRETVQNTWDARRSDEQPISYTMHGWSLTAAQRAVLCDEVLHERPEPLILSLASLDSDRPLAVLSIADRGTIGLSGPTRADRVPLGAQRNFISFLRDVGQPSNKDFSGGTYGYGKASLYRASRLQTIVVYTRCTNVGDDLESRFIVASLGERWSAPDGQQYTGRVWWGQLAEDTVDPVINDVADDLAARLGMQPFAAHETGTTLLLLDPLFDDRNTDPHHEVIVAERSPMQSLNKMAEYALYCFWPKMLLGATGHPAIQFHFQWETTPVALPDPRTFPPLAGFVAAMDHLKGNAHDNGLASELHAIQSQRPKQHLGQLALQRFLVEAGERRDIGDEQSVFVGLTHHTALMRQPELVVKYHAGKPLPSTDVGYAGVFITDEAVDGIFAQAEPPTHDDWSPDSLAERRHKTFVRVALRRISEAMTQFAQTTRPTAPSGKLVPLGSFATWLGASLMPMETGTSANHNRQKSPRRQTERNTPELSPETPFSLGDNRGDSTPAAEALPISTTYNEYATPADPLVPSLAHSSDSVADTPAPPTDHPSLGMDGIADTPQKPSDAPASHAHSAPAGDSDAPDAPSPAPATDAPPPRKPIRGVSKVTITDSVLVEHAEQPALHVAFTVKHAENAAGTTISLKVGVILDNDFAEKDPPQGGSHATVIHWLSPTGELLYPSEEQITIPASGGRETTWQVLIAVPDDIMVEVAFDAKAEKYT